MSTSKHIDKICCIVLVFVIALSAVFVNADRFGLTAVSAMMGYEQRLFDTEKVHTIDIVMDDWEGFLDTCENEEYELCSLVIDNEAYKNVGIRAKGNTSLSMVSRYGNDRYSFKIEFDHYDQTRTYYGLDKLSLNNIIQDNTYMKDYLTYQMMGYLGAAAPLCSYVYLTVNGEEWGLYLAVEGVEESFLERNYGSDYGALYKPDSTNMGGGRGNGGGFDMDRFHEEREGEESENQNGASQSENQKKQNLDNENQEYQDPESQDPENQNPENENQKNQESQNLKSENQESQNLKSENQESQNMENQNQESQNLKNQDLKNENQESQNLKNQNLKNKKRENQNMENQIQESQNPDRKPEGRKVFGGFSGNGMGSRKNDDVSLIYTDDNYDSYSNIFDNAKTEITDADKDRLIKSLKAMNEGTDLAEVVNVDAVIRYFVVHNFVCNFDSYTGSMIHNYYLYEENGQLSMIPWDYNLAFGGFRSQSDADELINYPIDTPISGNGMDSRPMLAWIFNHEEYTEQYHQYFAEFIAQYFDSGYFSELIDRVSAMIAPYVEKDPTKFCTYEQFETGAAVLKEFCLLRAESIHGQLEGTIPSTAEGQKQEGISLVDGSSVTISDMGSMGNEMGGRPDRENMPGNQAGGLKQKDRSSNETDDAAGQESMSEDEGNAEDEGNDSFGPENETGRGMEDGQYPENAM